jgi:predicted ferric reductase
MRRPISGNAEQSSGVWDRAHNGIGASDSLAMTERSYARTVPGLGSGVLVATKEVFQMLLMIAGIILVLWLLGLVALPAAGSLIHILLIIAVIVIVLHFLGIGRSSTRV